MQITKMLRLTTIVMCVWTYLYTTEEKRVGRYGSDIRTAGSFSPPAFWKVTTSTHIIPYLRKSAGNKWSQLSTIITHLNVGCLFSFCGATLVGVKKLRLAVHFIDSLYLFLLKYAIYLDSSYILFIYICRRIHGKLASTTVNRAGFLEVWQHSRFVALEVATCSGRICPGSVGTNGTRKVERGKGLRQTLKEAYLRWAPCNNRYFCSVSYSPPFRGVNKKPS